MRIMRALPYVVSAVSLAVAAASWYYVMRLDRDQQISARAASARADMTRIERLDADVNDLITLYTRLNQRIEDVNSALDHFEAGVLLYAREVAKDRQHLSEWINTFKDATIEGMVSLGNRISATESADSSSSRADYADVLLRSYLDQMGRNMATPQTYSLPKLSRSPFLDAYFEELGRQAATPSRSR